MPPRTPPAAEPSTASTSKAGSIASYLKGHKTEAGLAAAGIVVTVALYVRSKGSNSNSSSATTPSTETIPVEADTSGEGGFSGWGYGGGIQSGASTTSSTPTLGGLTPSDAAQQQAVGSGYGPSSTPGTGAGDVVESLSGQYFQQIPGQAEAGLQAAGDTFDVETTPGQFTPISGSLGSSPYAGTATPIFVGAGVPALSSSGTG